MKLDKIIEVIRTRREVSFNEMEMLVIFALARLGKGSRVDINTFTGGCVNTVSAKLKKLSKDGLVSIDGFFIGLNNKQQEIFKLTNQGEAKAAELLCLNGGN